MVVTIKNENNANNIAQLNTVYVMTSKLNWSNH